jgi:glutamyl-Q tRNA(Asp) synthetase
LRLNIEKALQAIEEIPFRETGSGPDGETGDIRLDPDMLITTIGDVALRRPSLGAAYHLAVVVDDAAQGITEVVRGEDLFAATGIHVLLQRLLSFRVPDYHHHRLIRDDTSKRLAKRDDARALSTYRGAGETVRDIMRRLGLQETILAR